MQVYLDDNLDNFKTRFIQLICGYLEIEERNLGKIIYANEKTKEALSFPGSHFIFLIPFAPQKKAFIRMN